MSNNIYVQLPGWVGPGITQSIVEDILGGGGIEPHCYPEQTSCPDLGCWITLNLTGLGVKRDSQAVVGPFPPGFVAGWS